MHRFHRDMQRGQTRRAALAPPLARRPRSLPSRSFCFFFDFFLNLFSPCPLVSRARFPPSRLTPRLSLLSPLALMPTFPPSPHALLLNLFLNLVPLFFPSFLILLIPPPPLNTTKQATFPPTKRPARPHKGLSASRRLKRYWSRHARRRRRTP